MSNSTERKTNTAAESVAAELLAALEQIAARAHLQRGDDPFRECAHILAICRAAIKKARGA